MSLGVGGRQMPEVEVGLTNRVAKATGPSPHLCDFEDYRDFLAEKIRYLKAQNPRLSLGAFARRMNVSTAFISLLISKKKHLSLDTVASFSEALGFDESDSMLLVFKLLEERATMPQQKKFFRYFADQTTVLKHWQSPRRSPVNAGDMKKLLGSEMAMVISGLARTKDFRPDVEWVQSRLVGFEDHSKEEIAVAIREVLQARASYAAEESVWAAFPTPYPAGADGRSFYAVGIQLMQRSLDHFLTMQPHAFVAQGLAFSKPNADKAMEAFAAFGNKLKELSEISQQADQVYILNAGLFRVCRDA